MRAALKILGDVVAYRLRKLEMANLAGAVAIMFTLRLAWTDVVVRTLFAALLNALVYLNNDYMDVALDQRAPNKDPDKARFMRQHRRAALLTQATLLGLLVALAAAHSPGLLVTLVAGAGVCFAYSSWLKHHPLVDVLSMAAWGVAMPLAGTPLDRVLGLFLALQLGLMSSVFETIQVVRDHDTDRALGVRTTAVALGAARTRRLGRWLMALVCLYAVLVLHPVAGILSALALALPWRPERSTERFWTSVKVVYGAAWLGICASVWWTGHAHGLLLSAGIGDTLEWLHWTRR